MKLKFHNEYGDSEIMGPLLRKLVEEQLLSDLRNYAIHIDNLKFDWSESCIEGHRIFHIDGEVENFSSIGLINADGQQVAHGWMDFIEDSQSNFFLSYWELLYFNQGDTELKVKSRFGIPPHIWINLSDKLKDKFQDFQLKPIRKIP